MRSVIIRGVFTATLLATCACGAPAASPEPGSAAIRGFTRFADGSVLSDVEVCLNGEADMTTGAMNKLACTKSAADGSFTISAPLPGDQGTLTFEKDGFEPAIRPIEFLSQDITLPPNENVLTPDPPVFMGERARTDKGQIAFAAIGTDVGPVPEVSVTLWSSPIPTDTAVASVPMFVSADGEIAPGATAGTRGGFVNVDPGLYTIRFHPLNGVCAVTSGLYAYSASTAPNGDISIVVPALAGYVTAPVGVSCIASR
jgi:hypothetical protein